MIEVRNHPCHLKSLQCHQCYLYHIWETSDSNIELKKIASDYQEIFDLVKITGCILNGGLCDLLG